MADPTFAQSYITLHVLGKALLLVSEFERAKYIQYAGHIDHVHSTGLFLMLVWSWTSYVTDLILSVFQTWN